MGDARLEGFDPRTVDKVERLLDLLEEFGNLMRYAEGLACDDEARFHKAVLYYASLSAAFPHGFESRPDRFAGLRREYRDQLVPMLRKGAECDLDDLVRDVRRFIAEFVLPRDEPKEAKVSRTNLGAI